MIKALIGSFLLLTSLVSYPLPAQNLTEVPAHLLCGTNQPLIFPKSRSFTQQNYFVGFNATSKSILRSHSALWFTKKEKEKGFPGFAAEADSPYRLRLSNSGPIVGTGVGLLGTVALVRPDKTVLSIDEISRFDREQISGFDRGATLLSSQNARQLSDIMVFTSVGAPFLYLTKERSRNDFGRIVLIQFETGLVTTGFIALTKLIVNRPRPFVYNPDVLLEDKLTPYANESFFSGHTATVAAMSFFTATTFSQYYPESKWKVAVWTYAATLPALTGYLRYRAGVHYPTDIITGYVAGAAIGMLVPRIHQKLLRHKKKPLPVK
jgi:membrane-associated phospholipid phosphatase